jgi:hypothetical protein
MASDAVIAGLVTHWLHEAADSGLHTVRRQTSVRRMSQPQQQLGQSQRHGPGQAALANADDQYRGHHARWLCGAAAGDRLPPSASKRHFYSLRPNLPRHHRQRHDGSNRYRVLDRLRDSAVQCGRIFATAGRAAWPGPHRSGVPRVFVSLAAPSPPGHALTMFVVSEEAAALIRAVHEQKGELWPP